MINKNNLEFNLLNLHYLQILGEPKFLITIIIIIISLIIINKK